MRDGGYVKSDVLTVQPVNLRGFNIDNMLSCKNYQIKTKCGKVLTVVKRMFVRRQSGQDFSPYLDEAEILQSRKRRLLEDCKKNDVSIYIDKPSEQSSGVYAELRGVASEAELEQRLNAKMVVGQASRANVIASVALFVSIVALAKAFL